MNLSQSILWPVLVITLANALLRTAGFYFEWDFTKHAQNLRAPLAVASAVISTGIWLIGFWVLSRSKVGIFATMRNGVIFVLTAGFASGLSGPLAEVVVRFVRGLP